MLISKAFYRHLPIFLNLFKCPLRGSICIKKTTKHTHDTLMTHSYPEKQYYFLRFLNVLNLKPSFVALKQK
jgi:hypothetical protein